jgi:methylthioribose-1-phosphate isomerase
VTVADIFPTTSPLMLYEHRAGVLDYPTPQKPENSFALSPSQQRELKQRRDAEKREEYIRQLREKTGSPSRQTTSGFALDLGSEEESQSPSSRGKQKESQAIQEELSQERVRSEDLEEKVASLTRITRTLVEAIQQSQNILKACVDDPETRSVLDL